MMHRYIYRRPLPGDGASPRHGQYPWTCEKVCGIARLAMHHRTSELRRLAPPQPGPCWHYAVAGVRLSPLNHTPYFHRGHLCIVSSRRY